MIDPYTNIQPQPQSQTVQNIVILFFLASFIISIVLGGIYIYKQYTFNSNSSSSTKCSEGKIYDTTFEKCLSICPEKQEHKNGSDECTLICEDGTTLCGKTECIDKFYTCVSDKKCLNTNVRSYTDTDGIVKNECCPIIDGKQTVPKGTIGRQTCEKCLFNVCGDKCCPNDDDINKVDPFNPDNKHPGSRCLSKDGIYSSCCDPKHDAGDGVCCQTDLCDGKCCADTETCNPLTQKCSVKCGDKFCDDDEFCSTFSGTPTCKLRTCNWDNVIYTPPIVTSYGLNKDKFPFYNNTENSIDYKLPTCRSSDKKVDPLWLISNPQGAYNLSSKITQNLIPSTKFGKECENEENCISKIYQFGVDKVRPSYINGACTADVNCKTSLPSLDKFTKDGCPIKLVNNISSQQCCIDPTNIQLSKFNGQVCEDGMSCFVDGLTNKCYSYNQTTDSNKYCNNGVVDRVESNKLICKCNPPYIGDRCQYSDAITCKGKGTVDYFGNCNCLGYINNGKCDTFVNASEVNPLLVTSSPFVTDKQMMTHDDYEELSKSYLTTESWITERQKTLGNGYIFIVGLDGVIFPDYLSKTLMTFKWEEYTYAYGYISLEFRDDDAIKVRPKKYLTGKPNTVIKNGNITQTMESFGNYDNYLIIGTSNDYYVTLRLKVRSIDGSTRIVQIYYYNGDFNVDNVKGWTGVQYTSDPKNNIKAFNSPYNTIYIGN